MSWKFQYHTKKSRFRIMINNFYHFMIIDVRCFLTYLTLLLFAENEKNQQKGI